MQLYVVDPPAVTTKNGFPIDPLHTVAMDHEAIHLLLRVLEAERAKREKLRKDAEARTETSEAPSSRAVSGS